MWITSSTASALKPTAVALGNFDGIHRGHQQVIEPILKDRQVSPALAVKPPLGEEHNQFEGVSGQHRTENCENPVAAGSRHPYATVATFNPHPREFFSGKRLKLLTPKSEKAQQLSQLGVEQLILLPFDQEIASLSPQQFVEIILVQQLEVKRVSVGEDFRFGHQRRGTATDLQAIAASYGIDVIINSLKTSQGERISSSIIRQSLEQGNIALANRLLGRPYTLTGVVVKGQQLGRTIGFPTANLQLPPEKFLPRQGVYCVRVFNSSQPLSIVSHPGVMNLGQRPTVSGTCLTVEIHLLEWSGDLYGQTLTISLEQFLRPEQKFTSLEALKTQIQADCAAARAVLGCGG